MNNKGADQPAHPCSLISTFVVRYLDSENGEIKLALDKLKKNNICTSFLLLTIIDAVVHT